MAEFTKDCDCCGATYSLAQWVKLAWLGLAMGFAWRNCPCGSTLVVSDSLDKGPVQPS